MKDPLQFEVVHDGDHMTILRAPIPEGTLYVTRGFGAEGEVVSVSTTFVPAVNRQSNISSAPPANDIEAETIDRLEKALN